MDTGGALQVRAALLSRRGIEGRRGNDNDYEAGKTDAYQCIPDGPSPGVMAGEGPANVTFLAWPARPCRDG